MLHVLKVLVFAPDKRKFLFQESDNKTEMIPTDTDLFSV